MTPQIGTSRTLSTLAALAVGLIAPSIAGAQPPAQGPAPSTPKAFSLTVTSLTGQVMAIVNQVVAEQNALLANDPAYRAVISVTPTVYSPAMISTSNFDRPNEFAASTPYMLNYKVTGMQAKVAGQWISYPFERNLFQSLSVQTTCDGWYQGRGALRHLARANPPVLDTDHSFLEEALSYLLVNRIPSYIDTQIKARLANLPVIAAEVPSGNACSTLGVHTRAMGFPYDTIEYDVFPVISTPGFTSNITVTVLQVKRLPPTGSTSSLYTIRLRLLNSNYGPIFPVFVCNFRKWPKTRSGFLRDELQPAHLFLPVRANWS